VTLIAWEFITAGTDTTSATMHWLVALLALHPEVQRKAQAEIDAYCKGRRINADDNGALPYVSAVLRETMRLYPVVPLMVPYQTTASTTVEGFNIPKGSQVLVNQYAMARNDQLWKDSASFNPDRFMTGPDAELELRAADAPNECKFLKFIPMGTGRRACAGYMLAKVELFMQAATLIQCFDWQPTAKGLHLREKFGIAVSPHDFEICAIFRKESGLRTKPALA